MKGMTRTQMAGMMAWNATPDFALPAMDAIQYYAGTAVDAFPAASYAVARSSQVINTMDIQATGANLMNNFTLWTTFNGNDRY